MRAGCWLRLPFIGSAPLYKDAKEHWKEIGQGSRLSSFWIWLRNIEPLTSGVVLRYLSPFSPFSASQFRVWISRSRPTASALFHRVNSADYRHGGGGALGSPLAGISPNKQIRFFDDFSILILHLALFIVDIFSPWNWGFFLCYMYWLPGDSYSTVLLFYSILFYCCVAKKQPPRHTSLADPGAAF